MGFAKVKDDQIIQYPYTYYDLCTENPSTRYDSRRTVPEWYALSDEAVESGSQVVDVVLAPSPEYDDATYYAVQKNAPELVEGVWVLGWDIVERPPVSDLVLSVETDDPT